MPRRLSPNFASEAKSIREVFQDAPSTRRYSMAKEWPAEFCEVGRVLATSYSSDKWRNQGDYEEFKHLAETPCCVHVVPSMVRRFEREGWRCHGPTRPTSPRLSGAGAVAELAPFLCMDVLLYSATDRAGRGVVTAEDKYVCTIAIKDSVLFAGKVPGTSEYFLCVATPRDGVLMIATGNGLRITKDGIVG